MVTPVMARMVSPASRHGSSGLIVAAVLASQRLNASCSAPVRSMATCIVTAHHSASQVAFFGVDDRNQVELKLLAWAVRRGSW